jgi:hypothetical protein
MVTEPTKTQPLRLSWRFSVVSRRKLLLKSRDPVEHDRIIDLTIAWWKVNAAN